MWFCRLDRYKRLWEIGFFSPSGEWVTVHETDNWDDAAKWVHYLNGGLSLNG